MAVMLNGAPPQQAASLNQAAAAQVLSEIVEMSKEEKESDSDEADEGEKVDCSAEVKPQAEEPPVKNIPITIGKRAQTVTFPEIKVATSGLNRH